MDKVSRKKRSQIMSKVRSKDTKIEIEFRTELWKKGYRYKKNVSKLKGKPDLYFPKYRTVVFIDSCFWHGCKKHLRMPSSNRGYWESKIRKNINRDKEINKYFKQNGYKIIRVWEHDIQTNLDKSIKRIIRELKK
ncbi:very short patch repair endonuclease [Candidatus Dojkabacteria bacterium]|nr:very short patch repair endonuclease [Candidatus Dojkabacteria bacterium]